MSDIAFLPENLRGRDFLLSDLHGELALLQRLLEHVRFDPQRDRLISVGDLVDRGPSSLEGLALLQEPWFHAVKGNHEAYFVYNVFAMMEYVRFKPSQAMGDAWLAEAWARHPEKIKAYARLAEALPTVLTHAGAQRFHVVHGALSCRGSLLDDAALDRLQLLGEATEADWCEMQWRSRAVDGAGKTLRQSGGLIVPESPADTWHPRLSLTICGHTVCPELPVLVRSHLHIDSGGCSTTGDPSCALNLLQYVAPAHDSSGCAKGLRFRLYQSSAIWGIRDSLIELEYPT